MAAGWCCCPSSAPFSPTRGPISPECSWAAHRGITRVSPNKSLEGYIGGILSGAVFLLLYGLVLRRFAGLIVSLPILALYGLLGSAITELGDLSFSLIKRQYGIKDYGHLLPGHGGMLDRFDSMTFAAPMLLLLVEIIPAF